MIRIAITEAAYEAIAATLPLGTVGYEVKRTEKGEVHIWLEEPWLDKLTALRPPPIWYPVFCSFRTQPSRCVANLPWK
jgi:hypothetical protein